MNERTIMIFPEFENIEIINKIREKYDPLSNLVRPHITLVFPFKSNMTTEEVSERVKTAIMDFCEFPIEMSGFSREISKFGNYLFLNITKGAEKLTELSCNLYNNKPPFPYMPHMTVGKFESEEELNAAYVEVCKQKEMFKTMVDTVSVEIIGEHGESIIEIQQKLRSIGL